jgi:hypothetical protein
LEFEKSTCHASDDDGMASDPSSITASLTIFTCQQEDSSENVDEFLQQNVQEGIESDGSSTERRLVVDDDVATFIHFDVTAVK